jgi:hypothetical protein
MGSKACKLPCGHLYHRECLEEWLLKHCTCMCLVCNSQGLGNTLNSI